MESENYQKRKLSSGQKVGFVLLVVFGILTVGMGLIQMRNTIYNPFVIKPSGIVNSQAFLDDSVRLQQIDTDNDTLSDYDELQFYNTSPYLPDTDSDGIDDNVEIADGTDPLCPEGQNCDVLLDSNTPQEEDVSGESPISTESGAGDFLDLLANSATSAEESSAGTAEDGTLTEEDMNAQLDTIMSSPELLRQLLLSTGQITEEQLAGVTDEELLNLVQEINSQ